MNDSRPTERFSPPQPRYSPSVDPAYADQTPYAPTYGPTMSPWAPAANETNPTKQLPAYWQQELPGRRPARPGHGSAAGRAEIAALAVDRRGRGGAAGGRPGDRAGARQRRDQDADRRAAVAGHAGAEPGDADDVDAQVALAHPGADTAHQRARAAHRDDRPGRDAGRRLHRVRGGPGDQHHVHRHRRPHPDRIQCRVAVEQAGQPVQVRRAPGQRHDRQHRSQRHLHRDRQRGSGQQTRRRG